jgi:hypothetical protein
MLTWRWSHHPGWVRTRPSWLHLSSPPPPNRWVYDVLYYDVCMYHEVFEYYHNKYVCMLQHVTPPECHMPPSPRLLFQPTTCFCVSCSLRPRLLRPRLPLLFCPLALPRSGARVFDSLALRFRCCALGLGTCEKEDSNNNNDALLSQTWVIATTAVLRVRTVPDVEPHTPGMTSPGLFSSCGRAPAR